MRFEYRDYPVLISGKPTLTSGAVQIEMTRPPRLERLNFQGISALTVPRASDTPYLKWKFVGDIEDDLKRFISGKYWYKIDTSLFAEHLEYVGLLEAAEVWKKLANG